MLERMKLLAFLLALLLAITVSAAQQGPPNVVLIMADDLGYHDLGCYGHPKIKTPVLDDLARDGVKLTGFYAGATVCTPSRMALLTGAYPSRLGWTKGVVGHLMEPQKGLNPRAFTMGEWYQSQGYETALIGKWHLGDAEAFRPQRHGFDVTYYINKSNNQTDTLWRGDVLLEKPFENRRLTEKFTHEAIRFVKANKAKPFFLYLPYSAPHFPVEPHLDWRGRSAFGDYGDVVEEMDHRIGELLETLEDEKFANNTIVVFLSDNGPEPLTKESKAIPFRGKKWDALEGGTRVPCILRWPGVLPKGRVSDALIGAIDLLPTLSFACGIDFEQRSPERSAIDGVNVWPTLLGKTGTPHLRKDLLFWHGSEGFQAIRVGEWKLFLNGKAAKLEGGSPGPALFHLSEDPSEKTDLSARFPDRVAAMTKLAERRLVEIKQDSMALGSAD